jgi:hypothetical protein
VTFAACCVSSNVNEIKLLQLYYWHKFIGNSSHLLRVLSQILKGEMMSKQVDIHVDVDIQFRFRFIQVQVQWHCVQGWRHASSRPVSPSTWGIFQLVLSHLVTFGQPECNIRHEIIGRIDLHVQTPTCVAARNDRRIRLD